MSLGTFVKQPNEILDYIVDYSEWFVGRSDTPLQQNTTVDAGITLSSSTLIGTSVKVVLSGGTNGVKYKVTTRLTTTAGIVREGDFYVQVKEI
jgi:hypothetical protein